MIGDVIPFGGGAGNAAQPARPPFRQAAEPGRPALITGGAGFLGSNIADRLARSGQPVLIFDNLARPGVRENLAWLRERHGDLVEGIVADIRDPSAIGRAVARASRIYHLAAQVAVTTSVLDPIADFEVNLRGTLNLLEAVRAQRRPLPIVFASTNKVYGKLDGIALEETARAYQPADPAIRRAGIGERQPLDLFSPYGCSKGAADQYVLDYARVFGLRTVVFRMSCLYGPRQFGTEDQGWVAHFLIRALKGEPITIFGNGKQVRDILFVDDVVEAYEQAQAHIEALSGQVFNIGGGPANAVSLRELLDLIHRRTGRRPETAFEAWRPGDQPYYVSDTAKFQHMTGWAPRVDVEQGIGRLHDWLAERFGAPARRQAGAGVPA